MASSSALDDEGEKSVETKMCFMVRMGFLCNLPSSKQGAYRRGFAYNSPLEQVPARNSCARCRVCAGTSLASESQRVASSSTFSIESAASTCWCAAPRLFLAMAGRARHLAGRHVVLANQD